MDKQQYFKNCFPGNKQFLCSIIYLSFSIHPPIKCLNVNFYQWFFSHFKPCALGGTILVYTKSEKVLKSIADNTDFENSILVNIFQTRSCHAVGKRQQSINQQETVLPLFSFHTSVGNITLCYTRK